MKKQLFRGIDGFVSQHVTGIRRIVSLHPLHFELDFVETEGALAFDFVPSVHSAHRALKMV